MIMRFSWIQAAGRILAQLMSASAIQIVLGANPGASPPMVAIHTAVDALVREFVLVVPPAEGASSSTGGLLNDRPSSPVLAQPGPGWG